MSKGKKITISILVFFVVVGIVITAVLLDLWNYAYYERNRPQFSYEDTRTLFGEDSMFLDEKFLTDKGFTDDYGYGVTFKAKSKTLLNDYIVSGYDKKADMYAVTYEGEWEIGQGYLFVDRIDLSYDKNINYDITGAQEYKDFLYKVDYGSPIRRGCKVLVIRDGHTLKVELSLAYNDKVHNSEEDNKTLDDIVLDKMDKFEKENKILDDIVFDLMDNII